MGFKLKILFTLVAFLSMFHIDAFAQPHNKDSLKYSDFRPGLLWFATGWRPAKPEKLRKYDRLILDITYNQLFTPAPAKQNPWRSIGCNVNTMWDIPMNKGNTASFGIGLAYKFQKASTKGLFYKDTLENTTKYYADSGFTTYKKTYFGSHTLALPIEFRFRTPKWQHFKVHVGGSIGYRLQTFQKKWIGKTKVHDRNSYFPDENGFVYAVHCRIGIRNWALFADYVFAPHFYKKASTQTNNFSFGISLSLF